jgi:quercetin dioxygenase-like cupin family protein
MSRSGRQIQIDLGDSDLVECISDGDRPLAYVIRACTAPAQTCFVTPDDINVQVGFVVYPAGGEVPRHVHHPLERSIIGTSEVLYLRQGRCEVDLYSNDKKPVCKIELNRGDVLVMVAGGHGFHILEDTILLEVKQGPYGRVHEKERF